MSLGLDEQHRNARKLSMQVEQALAAASAKAGSAEAREALTSAKSNLDTIRGLLSSMDHLVLSEPANKKDMWKQKVKNVRDEYGSLARAWEAENRKAGGRAEEEADRESLFRGRPDGAGARGGGGGEGLDVESQTAYKRSAAGVEELEQRGMGILSDLAAQKERLKGVHRKLLDLLNLLGVSNSLLRVIEKRQTMDLVLMGAGMLATVVILAFTWIYFRR